MDNLVSVGGTADKSYQAAYQAAIAWLSRREYAEKELADKLKQQGHASEHIKPLLAELKQKDYQSDARFCEMFVRTRVRQHYGPTKIVYELKQKGVAANIVAAELSKYEDDWLTIANELLAKKQRSSKALSEDKLIRFLLNKGFDYALIKQVIRG